ncbi:L,D-transpeptidase [Roseateles sp. DAIF2]|nr:L,D-transpeptidase [Roseateles sp. DAIF2]
MDLNGAKVSPAARRVAAWVVAAADNGARPFAIIDKRQAQVLVFEPGGRLRGATPVLLGYAAGDDSVAGIGQRPIDQVRPEERTTPAGRFLAEPGRNALGEEVVWVDYEAAVSMHRVRLTDPRERRAERLASPSPRDNRISFGCVNMPPAFFEQVLWPGFRGRGGIVYVLPEQRSLESVFPALRDAATVTASR